MREIKFRLWNADTKEMIYPKLEHSQDYVLQLNCSYVGEFDKDRKEYLTVKMPAMQFTGLLHKSGKEIYEGDIFRQEKETDDGDIRSYLVVFWVKQRAAFYLVDVCHLSILENNDCSDEKEFDWVFQDAALYDFSIDVGLPLAGNIYEHSHLLK